MEIYTNVNNENALIINLINLLHGKNEGSLSRIILLGTDVVAVMWHSIILYDFEAWPVKVVNERVHEVFENDSICRFQHLKHRDHVQTVAFQRQHRLTCIRVQLAWLPFEAS